MEESKKSYKKGYRIVFLTAILFAMLFECLIFMRYQVMKIEDILRDDFRVILVLSPSLKKETILEKIYALKGVKKAELILSSQTMERIKQEDKELYYSLSAIGKNPIPDIIEVEVDDTALSNLENFVEEAMKVKGIDDVKYKLLEAYAIVHFSFYSNFLSVVISLVLLISSIIIFTGIAHAGFFEFFSSLKSSVKWFSCGFLAAICAIFFVYVVIYPVKYLSPVWSWPSNWWHLLVVIICGLFGWVFYQWKRS